MLPDISLDNENYDEIIENAKNMIAGIYPEWTDFNYHDPGMTFAELFAWIKEGQQYYINKIGSAHYEKYLKLLGITRETKRAAQAQISVNGAYDMLIAGGTKFYAGNICFEADENTYILADKITSVACVGKNNRIINYDEILFGGNLRIKPFEKKPSEDEYLYIGFDRPIACSQWINLRFEIFQDYPVKRKPITNEKIFVPFAELKVEYLGEGGWTEIKSIKDNTYGFICDGEVHIKLDSEMYVSEISGTHGFYLRFSVKNGDYDIPPIIENIDIHTVNLHQRDTKAEFFDFNIDDDVFLETELAVSGNTRIFTEDNDGFFTPINIFGKNIDPHTGRVTFTGLPKDGYKKIRTVNLESDFYLSAGVGYGTGLPFQEYDLESDEIEYETFEIMTELPDSGGKFIEWKKVKDFAGSLPSDFHYILDSLNGRIKFGDCFHGMAPEGEIIIIGYSATKGADGNITGGKINTMGAEKTDALSINNSKPAYGGKAEETAESCNARAYDVINSTVTAVNNNDYENIVTATQGLMIENCRVIQKGNLRNVYPDDLITSIVVKPYSPDEKGTPNSAYIKNIEKALENRRFLGMRIEVVSPEYVEVAVYADVNVKPYFLNAKQYVCDAVKEYFRTLKDDFGAEVSYGRLYGIIDRLECVSQVNALTIESYGSGTEKSKDGSLILRPNALSVLTQTEIVMNMDN